MGQNQGKYKGFDWYSLDWSKRNVELAREHGMSEKLVCNKRCEYSKIRHRPPAATPVSKPTDFYPAFSKHGRATAAETALKYGVTIHIAGRWVAEWKLKQDKLGLPVTKQISERRAQVRRPD